VDCGTCVAAVALLLALLAVPKHDWAHPGSTFTLVHARSILLTAPQRVILLIAG